MGETTRQLTQERRARLQAERKLDARQADMRKNIAQMERRAANLTEAIIQKRDQLDRLQAELERQQRETLDAKAREASAEDARARSESRLWLALETVHDGFAMYDADERLTCANRAFLSVFEGLEEVAPGVTYSRLCEILLEEGIVDPRMPQTAWLEKMRDRWRQEKIPDETISLWDGQFVKLTDRRLEDGGVVALGLNHTYERRITSAIETIPDGFVVFDRDDNMVMCNQRYRDLFPGPADMIRPGANYGDLLRAAAESGAFPDAVGRVDEWIEDRMRMHQSPSPAPIEQSLEGDRWLRIVEAGTPDGGRAGLRADVTETKRIEADLRQAREDAEAASRAKSQFLTNMNHEFRTPLNGIIGLTSVLREQMTSDGPRRLVRTVENSAQALLGIIENVLDTISHDMSYAIVASERFDLTDTILQVVRLLSPQIQLRNIDFRLDYAAPLPTQFVGDDPRLRQVLANLLGNACKFAGGGRVTLGISGNPDTGDPSIWELDFTIEDDGPGIPKGQSERIFHQFTQAESDVSRSNDGMGLGLSLSRAIVESMGGKVWHDDTCKTGARFRMSLSLEQSVADDAEDMKDLPRFRLVRDAGIPGQLLDARLTGMGLRFDASPFDGLSDDGDPDQPLLVQASVLATDPAKRLRHLNSLPHKRLLVLGCPENGEIFHGIDCLDLPSPPGNWPALIDALHRDPAPDTVPDLPARSLRILAAEDNKTNQLVLRKMLESYDVELSIVDSGAAAVDAVEKDPPDLIFMDISMPVMDGREATMHIREWQERTGHPPIKILALTANATAGDRLKTLAAGLDDVIVKPLDRDTLAKRIAEAQADLRKKAGASGSDNPGEKA